MRTILLLVALLARQEPQAVAGAGAGLSPRALEELIERLPPVGAEWIRPDDVLNGEWKLVPAAAEFRTRIEEGLTLTAEQWKHVLVSTGVLRLRERWPASQPFAVSMREPGWLAYTGIRLSPLGDELSPVEVGQAYPSTCGTYTMQLRRAWLYQELGTLLPVGRHRLAFELTLERGEKFVSAYQRRMSPPPEAGPPVGVFFRGEIAFDVDVVPTFDEAVPASSSPEIDAAVRCVMSLAFQDWSDGRTALLIADPDVRDPLLARLGLSLAIDVVHGDQVVQSVVVVPHAYDSLATRLSVHDGLEQTFGWTTLGELPAELEHDATARAAWSVRVRGTSDQVLALWSATSWWSGTVTLSLDELIARERAVAPTGRGPWIYMPTFK